MSRPWNPDTDDDPPPRELRALAMAVHNARIKALPTEAEQQSEFVLGHYGDDYKKAQAILDQLTDDGWLLVYNLLAARQLTRTGTA